ncbi:MAG: GTPase Era [Bacteroidota bacterium]
MHKSGFVSIIGRPNVGKSTLMNALVGERMSIITSKPQTTRHRILGIVSDEDYQLVFSDTPGIVVDPGYKMHEAMNRFVATTFEDSDVMLFVTDIYDKYEEEGPTVKRLKQLQVPLFLVINKMDLADTEQLANLIQKWNSWVNFKETIPISALNQTNTDKLLELILENTPEGPVYYPKDQLTDRPERFFVSEIIREKILQQYKKEVPYSCEVIVDSFKEDVTNKGENITRIEAHIYVNRKTQKPIIIGKGGAAIKKLGIESRKDIETFLDTKVYLELYVKIKENWRDNDKLLKSFGYQ